MKRGKVDTQTESKKSIANLILSMKINSLKLIIHYICRYISQYDRLYFTYTQK